MPNQGSAPPPPAASAITPASSSPDLKSPGDIFFDFDQYEVPRDAIPVLESNGLLVRDNPEQSFLIEGHCDERGTLAYNLVLGEKRAKAAKRYLEGLGISASRIQTTSYGEVKPFCKEHKKDAGSTTAGPISLSNKFRGNPLVRGEPCGAFDQTCSRGISRGWRKVSKLMHTGFE
ncbi:OmpA family protein [Nitrospira sp. NS4]|uniref:OmpA family protein n=1 Tax=Nitrospira sp. NS4 TaxID=3414498 RepID=UPI003C2B1F7A